MKIRELRILPPLAIGRLGSAEEPVNNYTIEDNPNDPLDFRQITPADTLVVDPYTGEISGSQKEAVTFRDGDRIRPVAPFLEVFAVSEKGEMVALTTQLLEAEGLSEDDISWRVEAGNRKVSRRTNDPKDAVIAETGWFSGHEAITLKGRCDNFVSADACIDFGQVRYIKPNVDFPQIRLRFTPAKGLIYGPKLDAKTLAQADPELYVVPAEQAIYDTKKGAWYKFEVPAGIDNNDPNYSGKFVSETLPPSLFAIDPPAPCWLNNNVAVSRGYLDDACDGIVEVALKLKGGKRLTAAARICAAPPALVPDSLFLRHLGDDLDQVIYGPAVSENETPEATRARALDIIRRAFETVRFLNVSVMNGNTVQGRMALAFDTMPAEEAFDTQRLMRPVVPERTADTLAIMALHQQVFAALRGGAAPWFAHILRQPTEVGDYTDHGRRKMPAMMCGADGSYLALTHRQINTIWKAAGLAMATTQLAERAQKTGATKKDAPKGGLTPRNLSAQIHYSAKGNPASSTPTSAIANCTPGLEVDFRAAWRRVFKGIVLREYDNLVMEMDGNLKVDLTGHRLLAVNGQPTMTQMIGPSPADTEAQSVVLATDANPLGVAPLEWSNALAKTLHEFKGKTVECVFTKEPVWLKQALWKPEDDQNAYKTIRLEVRDFFEPGTALISRELAVPGELTQGLCSPWQNDYRECSCYYWASARPDFVNVQPTPTGTSSGDNWLQKVRTGSYVPDDYVDSRLILYDDLFKDWERYLRFQIGGNDAAENPPI